jgi:hypothetical protein
LKTRTKQQLCREIAERWADVYASRYAEWPDKAITHQRLVALNGNGTEVEIAAIIGNNSWTENRCHECGKDAQTTVQLGEEPDYDTCFAFACLTCLRYAARLAVSEGEKRRKNAAGAKYGASGGIRMKAMKARKIERVNSEV